MRLNVGNTRTGGPALQCRAAGRTLLIHPKGDLDSQATAFAAGLAPDPQHTVAVVDLPLGSLEQSADSVAHLLEGRGESLRLIFGRATPQESRRAAQRIADRLGRLVLAPDGEVLPTSGGGLFIPSDLGGGWLRFRPGRKAEPDSRRFPKPRWEFSTSDRPWPTSGHGVVEPVASGVWVRSPHASAYSESSQSLVDRLPNHPEILTVILGNPGGPPIPLSDVTRFWETVLPSVRSWVRFCQLGPVALPEGGEGLGQGLADSLGQRVVFYAGVPVQARVGLDSPEVVTLRPDGRLGHRPFVRELMYFPRTGRVPVPPSLFGLRHPFLGVPEITTGVYELASDAVLEVVQSGLWVRTSTEPADGDAVRRIPGGPGYAAILYDRSNPGVERRMRSLAEDVLWKLDPDLRESFSLVPADDPGTAAGITEEAYLWSSSSDAAFGPQAVAAPATRPSRPVGLAPWTTSSQQPPEAGQAAERERAESSDGMSARTYSHPDDRVPAPLTTRGEQGPQPGAPMIPLAASTAPDAPTAELPRTESDAARTGADDANAAGDGGGTALITPATGVSPSVAADRPGPDLPTPEPRHARPTRSRLPDLRPVSGPDIEAEQRQEKASHSDAHIHGDGISSTRGQRPQTPSESAPRDPQSDPESGPTGTSEADTPRLPASVLKIRESAASEAVPAAPADGSSDPGDPTDTPSITGADSEGTDQAPAQLIRLESDTPASAPDPDPAPKRSDDRVGLPADGSTTPSTAAGVQVQPVPKASACAVPPERGIGKERDWVRRTFSTQYNALAGTVSRVMSESPGLRGGRDGAADALTDLVSVRLYLSGDTAGVDEEVRTATVGPHVPLVRCVTAGLRRLPSYRGAALLRAQTTAAERAWYREGALVAEWACCAAYSAPHPGPEGATDFLIWSMTARRTNLLDPSEPYRVMFLPGTVFKVLRPFEGEDPIMMRELSPSEATTDRNADTQRVPLDEIALDGLERAAAALRANKSGSTGAGAHGDAGLKERLGTPPGLMNGTRRKRSRGVGGDVSAPDEGVKL
ncbi:hypothetical protein [Actinacidiphila glaucinigra]|uniref:hypothetical protein n=1 Tax=Actinacidiphila glaucinigra TaxID=235986 RepID=UPI0035E13000